jgi:hypothetical protein
MPSRAWAEIGLPDQSNARSHFYLSDLTSTRQILLDAGFSKVLAWYSVSIKFQSTKFFYYYYFIYDNYYYGAPLSKYYSYALYN